MSADEPAVKKIHFVCSAYGAKSNYNLIYMINIYFRVYLTQIVFFLNTLQMFIGFIRNSVGREKPHLFEVGWEKMALDRSELPSLNFHL